MLGKDSIKGSGDKKINTGFLRKTLLGISRVFEGELLTEINVRKTGLLQSIDIRVRLLSMLFFMIFAGLTHSIPSLVVLAFVAVMLARFSALGTAGFIKRVWLFIPLLVLIVSIPAATSLLIQGKPVFYLYKSLDIKIIILKLPSEIYFSAEGIAAAIRMSLRVGVSFSYGYLLMMTTGWSHLAKSLGILRVPAIIISILDMTYRFIFVLVRLSIEIFEARYLRTVGKIKNSENRTFIARSMAFLFLKANYMSEEIYESMVCRGYTGSSVIMDEFKLSRGDFVWIFNMLIIILVLLVL